MAEENGSPRFGWSDKQELGKLRSDHESAYREFQLFREQSNRQFDRIDIDLRSVLPLPAQVQQLTAALDRLAEKLDSVAAGTGASQRANWMTALAVISVVVTMLLAVARGFH